MRKLSLVLASMSVVVLAVGCSDKGTIDEDDRKAAAENVPPPCDTSRWSVDPQSTDGGTNEPVYDVATGYNACYDEIGFVIDTPDPVGYRVEYTDAPRKEDGSPMVLPVGDRIMQVTILARGGQAFNDGQAITLEGDRERYGAIQDVLFGGRTEQATSFVLGVRGDLPFTVTANTATEVSTVTVKIARPTQP